MTVVREFLQATSRGGVTVVVVADVKSHPSLADLEVFGNRVRILDEDFTNVAALERAGVHHASKAVLLSDLSQGRSVRDADARTVLAALTIEKLNENVYTCAEINHREHAHHLEMGNVNDYVVTNEHAGVVLAQAVLTRGIMRVVAELLTHAHGNRFVVAKVPSSYKGRAFADVLTEIKSAHDAVVVAIRRGRD
ncbi:MAG: NAD-binding protein, partial [Myxococcales bacterium]|nr:NAD-binding protein [Myxococcales bacterium]